MKVCERMNRIPFILHPSAFILSQTFIYWFYHVSAAGELQSVEPA
jgi:hypothetical protein